MSDNLLDRITRVMNRELLAQLPDARSSGDDLAPSPSGTINLHHLADAVIRELGLIRDPFSTSSFHRYVTDWKATE